MSNFLAIATVTEAFRQMAESAASEAIPGARAKVLRPPTSLTSGHPKGEPDVFVGLYLYQVTPNAAQRNASTPTRRSDGSVAQVSRAPFDLHYLFTFYGDDNTLEPQRVMGAVLRRIQTQPLLTKAAITSAKSALGSLATSNLDTETELVKFLLLPLSLEEMSKLWSVFFQTTYCLSMAYQASVVFIDGAESARPSLPVRQRNLYVKTFRQPVIEQIVSRKTPTGTDLVNEPIIGGDYLVLKGKQLSGDVTRVRVGGALVTPAITDVTDAEILFQLKSPPFAAAELLPGVLSVQVVQDFNMGTPETAHKGIEGNVSAFVLHPTVTPTLSNKTVDGSFRKFNLKLDFAPLVGVKQRVILLLNEFDPPPPTVRPAYAYRFEVTMPPAPPDAVSTVTMTGLRTLPAKYLVRVQVDGAESLLGQDAGTHKFNAPQVDAT